MASTQLSLLGLFPSELYLQIYQILLESTNSCIEFEIREEVWIRGAEPITDENRLRIKFESSPSDPASSSSSSSSWLIQVLQKPDPVRLSPEVLSRSIFELSSATSSSSSLFSLKGKGGKTNGGKINDDSPSSTISALGYSKSFELFYKGCRFRKGAVVIELFRFYESLDSKTALDPTSYLISVTNKITPRTATSTSTSSTTITTTGNINSTVVDGGGSILELKAEGIERIKEMKEKLRGLVSLKRVE